MDTPDDPTDALSVLADDTRLTILRTLAEADGPLSFTRLRERTGVRDSGRFSYHLRRLCEYFVRETDGGYELGHAGARLIDASVAATGSSGASRQGGPVRDGGHGSTDGGHGSTDGHGRKRSTADGGSTVDDGEACPVCGDADCRKFFGVHLSPPWA